MKWAWIFKANLEKSSNKLPQMRSMDLETISIIFMNVKMNNYQISGLERAKRMMRGSWKKNSGYKYFKTLKDKDALRSNSENINIFFDDEILSSIWWISSLVSNFRKSFRLFSYIFWLSWLFVVKERSLMLK